MNILLKKSLDWETFLFHFIFKCEGNYQSNLYHLNLLNGPTILIILQWLIPIEQNTSTMSLLATLDYLFRTIGIINQSFVPINKFFLVKYRLCLIVHLNVETALLKNPLDSLINAFGTLQFTYKY